MRGIDADEEADRIKELYDRSSIWEIAEEYTEESAESTDTFIGLLETALERKASGEDPDFDGMLDSAVEVLQTRYRSQNLNGNVSAKTALCIVLC